ncbi:hypothetical protein G4P69_33535 [Aetokthonos hydrillicola CCALA 1050]|nr:hypothetical protein [Aetokthonos hydrillicola CCALA 1050]
MPHAPQINYAQNSFMFYLVNSCCPNSRCLFSTLIIGDGATANNRG